jgi:hypothetical protein
VGLELGMGSDLMLKKKFSSSLLDSNEDSNLIKKYGKCKMPVKVAFLS